LPSPNYECLYWSGFAEMVNTISIPVFVLRISDLIRVIAYPEVNGEMETAVAGI
jgi:hypothetical protein